MRKLLLILMLTVMVLGLSLTSTSSYLVDAETSSDNTIEAWIDEPSP
jgi:hypothetical protein